MDAPATDPRDAELLEQLGWVRRLALAQVRDRHAADDLAQEVARVWLEKRPRLEGGPRSWLAAVARRLVIDRARSDASRAARERSAAPVAKADGAFEVVERSARQRSVFDAVLELPEPYRSTILYRYFDDLATRDVAQRTGVNEATVRKRVERGLALLRARLDREFGSRPDAWAIALLGPGWKAAVGKGTVVMSAKWFAAAGVVALLAGGAWYWQADSGAELVEAVGGVGVVVPAEVAAERERAPAVLADAGDVERRAASAVAAAPTVAPPSATAPGLRGFIFVDDVHVAPDGLSIVRKVDQGDHTSIEAVRVDGARWSIDDLAGAPGRLWVKSDTTVPAQIPIPPEVWTSGGVFDLHLSTGRTLDLTLVDRATQQPIAGQEFQVARSVVVERGRGRTTSDGNQTMHRTDVQGRARVVGIPLEGSLAVTVDAEARERDIVMRDGARMRMRMQREPDWRTFLKKEMPARLEQTVLVSPSLGEACAGGQVPAWAIAAAGGADAVRVVARETVNESPQARGTPFLLPVDERGRFELCASAPDVHAVWLEKVADNARISAETSVTFAAPGAQDDVVFRELEGRSVTLRFVRVPARGTLQATLAGKSGMHPAGSWPCGGADFTREMTVSDEERIQLTLRFGGADDAKSGWTRYLTIGDEREFVVDLGGSERTLRLESADIGPRTGDGAIALLRVEGGEVVTGQSILALCSAGRALSPVHVPDGRWLYRYEDQDQVAVWGAVDVAAALTPGEELLLQPRLRIAPLAELRPGIRFDEIEGIGLANLPEKLRTLHAKGSGDSVAIPRHARYVVLDAAK